MRLSKIKKESDLPDLGVALGVDIKLQVVDDKIEAVIVTNLATSQFIRIVKEDAYGSSLKILTEQPKVEQEVWYVEGDLLGLSPYKLRCKDKYDADSKLSDIMEQQGIYKTGS